MVVFFNFLLNLFESGHDLFVFEGAVVGFEGDGEGDAFFIFG